MNNNTHAANVAQTPVSGNNPRNFSFAALSKRLGAICNGGTRVTPAPFTLFIEDYKVKQGTYNELYYSAWRAYGNTRGLELSFIIC